ncbi:hypothetical protein NJB1907f44_38930 [Mycobacterium marinum]|nr:hypothetical protein NJB1907f22_33760 [Mycobacterium marinum]GJO45775.1 hypothetical protein NJB1907f3_12960 [Mycobacterium marinum]GJO64608.1 hypothetical protein NJB1907E39_35980 [Mycobacterium marinum]GJO72186.1 hypothetical protein NJB1907E49_00820 [Mycobacterium marinum]GJO80711.1 hypothetical protein NJB1907f34a_50220 [Mycobacterium marinum]
MQQTRVGYETAAQLLLTAGDNPDRIASEAAFAALCGVAPIPASSGKTRRHRLSHGGDRASQPGLAHDCAHPVIVLPENPRLP